mmetsp:Transcript_177495/g.569245  ORF Transcript_177495/g.569245 Transcript_177495/m.569245 type:complete len:348 (+) Transcript_177495:1791-2834(+)
MLHGVRTVPGEVAADLHELVGVREEGQGVPDQCLGLDDGGSSIPQRLLQVLRRLGPELCFHLRARRGERGGHALVEDFHRGIERFSHDVAELALVLVRNDLGRHLGRNRLPKEDEDGRAEGHGLLDGLRGFDLVPEACHEVGIVVQVLIHLLECPQQREHADEVRVILAGEHAVEQRRCGASEVVEAVHGLVVTPGGGSGADDHTRGDAGGGYQDDDFLHPPRGPGFRAAPAAALEAGAATIPAATEPQDDKDDWDDHVHNHRLVDFWRKLVSNHSLQVRTVRHLHGLEQYILAPHRSKELFAARLPVEVPLQTSCAVGRFSNHGIGRHLVVLSNNPLRLLTRNSCK